MIIKPEPGRTFTRAHFRQDNETTARILSDLCVGCADRWYGPGNYCEACRLMRTTLPRLTARCQCVSK